MATKDYCLPDKMNFVESASPLNSSNASRNDNIIVQPIETDPPVKNKRGMPSEYFHQGTAEDLGELKLKAKENGLTFKDSVGRNAYSDCKNANCGYKWKCRLNDDLFYEIFETIEEHNHDNIAARKNGLTNRQKEIIIHRINCLESVNAESCLQAFRNEGICSLPTGLQVRNFVYQQKQKSGVVDGKLSFTDVTRRQTLSSTNRNRPGAPKKHTKALQR